MEITGDFAQLASTRTFDAEKDALPNFLVDLVSQMGRQRIFLRI